MIILAFALVFLAFVLLFIGAVAIFLRLKHRSGNKYFTIAFVIWIFVIAFAIRAACVFSIADWNWDNNNFGQNIIDSLDLIYSTFGGLTFEGQGFDETAPAAAFGYYMSILWLAVTYLFVITLGLNYELDSKVRLFFYRHPKISGIVNRSKKKKLKELAKDNKNYFTSEIFIFTSITEDSLILAKSIEEHSKERNREPIIIFAGYNIPPYDKEDELHREIMMNGYIYQSFYKSKVDDKEKPLLELLKFAKKDKPIEALFARRVNVFSLNNDKNEVGFESSNSDISFKDIDASLNSYFEELDGNDDVKKEQNERNEKVLYEIINRGIDFEAKRNKKYDYTYPGLNYLKYFILSNSTVNHEFYDKQITNLLKKYFLVPTLIKKILINKRLNNEGLYHELLLGIAKANEEKELEELKKFGDSAKEEFIKKAEFVKEKDLVVELAKKQGKNFEELSLEELVNLYYVVINDRLLKDRKVNVLSSSYQGDKYTYDLTFEKDISELINLDYLKNLSYIKDVKLINKNKNDKIIRLEIDYKPVVELVDVKGLESVFGFLKLVFQTKVINESYLAGMDLVKKRIDLQINSINVDLDKYKNSGELRYRYAINRVKNIIENKKNIESASKSIPLEQNIKEDTTPVEDLLKEIAPKGLSGSELDDFYADRIEAINNKNDETAFRVLILGFGQTGQMALNNLFVNTASIEPDLNKKFKRGDRYIPSRFIAHIFDSEISKNLGIFAQIHPSYLVKKVKNKTDYTSKDVTNPAKNRFYNLDHLLEFYNEDYAGHFAEIDELMKFPFIYGHETNCKDVGFLEEIDDITGNIDANKKNNSLGKINAFVIALGDDEQNIAVANAIIQNIRQEIYHRDPMIYTFNKGIKNAEKVVKMIDSLPLVKYSCVRGDKLYIVYKTFEEIESTQILNAIREIEGDSGIEIIDSQRKIYFHQTIYVNVRDEKNLSRLNWRDEIEDNNHPGVYVRTFGNREDLYSYDSVIDEKDAIRFQHIYHAVDDYFNESNIYSLPDSESRVNTLIDEVHRDRIFDLLESVDKNRAKDKRDYLNLISYKKESNIYASQFSKYFETYISKIGFNEVCKKENREMLKYLAVLEHVRWCRFCISYGYIYSGTFEYMYKPYHKGWNKDSFSYYKSIGFIDNIKDFGKGFLKLHVDLLPYTYEGHNYLDVGAEIYDYANVIFPSLKIYKESGEQNE